MFVLYNENINIIIIVCVRRDICLIEFDQKVNCCKEGIDLVNKFNDLVKQKFFYLKISKMKSILLLRISS